MKYLLMALLVAAQLNAFGQLDKLINDTKKAVGAPKSLTKEEVANGLKEALVNGITKGTDLTSKMDGYFKNPEIKIPFPQDVKKVEDKLRQLGMGSEVDRFVLTLNRGAEEAAKEAKPIFISAIKQMSIDDAFAVLKGQPDAATQFLKRTTSAQLKEKFKPVVQTNLDKVNATKYYGDLISNYNRIPFVSKVNPNLNEYATDMAIQGLFTMIAKEEKSIRQDPAARTSELLKKVFGSK
ncbi:MAG: DUF4197 domain-containing protein [Cytophagales bacterium]|jgi:hypothetical protein|nr:DUF4197 domain-containing protein [Cytophagales bacterium]MCA6388256.1 DUF4197 domain-containing protein [Cytophagales bacterium]MCA6392401.1 DUF4197 domain-containing protein [Cytophagales bacterium]MCA6395652.1 DUF4197 domain-containing protein [Cytophagales bacterium]MCA6398500.1 DUF4197 domain-containing protein [Cytophagales bacterium]